MTTSMTAEPFCSLETIDTGETIYGTAAAETTVWFLLEYTEPWTAKAVSDNQLPPHVQAWFNNYLQHIPQSRLLFIKQDKRQAVGGAYRFYVAVTREQDQRLYAFSYETYDELLWLNLDDVVSDDNIYQQNLSNQLLYLICTNGKRDRCCAKFGLELYGAMQAVDRDTVWQVTHIGGHRYAPTFAVFPQGTYYGLAQSNQAAEMMQTIGRGDVVLANYRGRTCYSVVAQAADYYLRVKTGNNILAAFSLEGQTQLENGQWRFDFSTLSGNRYVVTVAMSQSEPMLAGCTTIKYKPRPLFDLVDLQQR